MRKLTSSRKSVNLSRVSSVFRTKRTWKLTTLLDVLNFLPIYHPCFLFPSWFTMNYSDTHDCVGPYIPSNPWASNAYSVMLSMSREYCSPPDVRNVSDDRIFPQFPRDRYPKVESTADGDVVIVQPSFDDDSSKNKSPFSSPSNKHTSEWQARSPQQEGKLVVDSEERNPCSPRDHLQQGPTHNRRHTRNLSSLFDATSIGRCGSSDSAEIYNDHEAHEFVTKHKRAMSGLNDPKVAHRRLDSIGSSQPVHNRQYHQREHSAGLEILSAVADASKEELAQAAGEQRSPHRREWEPTHPHGYNVALCHYPPPPPHLNHSPASHRFSGPPQTGVFVPVHGPYPPHGGYMTYPPYFSSNYMHRQEYPVQQYPPQHESHPPSKGTMRPPENRFKQPDSIVGTGPTTKESEWNESHRRTLSFLDGREGNTGSRPVVDGSFAPFQSSHHRKMSSFSVGLGNIFCSSVMSPGGDQDIHPLTKGVSQAHHRSTSSTVSFLNSLDVEGLAGSADDTFLRNLHESSNSAYQSPTPMDEPTGGNANVVASNSASPKLASGGTSKRVRRKCTVNGCVNRVVQGGLCISHGAKRKLCSHPGCTKNVKKSGLCSTHGPARKRCDAFGCKKVAVQGGRCIAHGARKKLCEVDDCGKQAILGGMCKKHHDQIKGGGVSDSGAISDASSTSKRSPPAHKASHTRGLSIFHEIPATELESMINRDATTSITVSENPPGRDAADGIW